MSSFGGFGCQVQRAARRVLFRFTRPAQERALWALACGEEAEQRSRTGLSLDKPDSWNAAANAVEDILQASQEPFDSRTVANARDLVSVCQSRYRVAQDVRKGYWSTIILSWSGLEIEVFEDRFELYRFQSQKIDITYFERLPGTPVPIELLDALAEAFRS